MAAFLAFGLGYIMRPIGGVIFGHIGDHYGQGKALYLSISLIAFPTFLIGALPTEAKIGITAPILLVVFRIVQGLSVGGQYSGALAVLRNNQKPRRGAQGAAMAYIGCMFGFLLASFVGFLSTRFFHDQWAWRLPFLATLIMIPPLLLTRRSLISLHIPTKKRTDQPAPIVELISRHPGLTFRVTILACFGGVYYSSFFVFIISYMKVTAHIAMHDVFVINMLCLMSSAVAIMYFARLADRIGRKPIIVASSLGLAILTVPSFLLIDTAHLSLAFLGMWLLTTANTAFMAACAVVYVEMFPKRVQFTGCSLAYNIGAGVIGGLTPAALSYLFHLGHLGLMAGFIVAVAALAAFFISRCIPETLPNVSVRHASGVCSEQE